MNQVTKALGLELSEDEYIPVHLKVGVEIHAEVVDDVVVQLKRIADVIADDI